MDAAFHVLAREGLAGASIEMIVEEAGFTRGAFYSNFSSKEELFAAVLDNEMRKRLSAVSAAVESLRDVPVARAASPEILTEFLRRVIVDPHSEREWQIIMVEFELYSLRNPNKVSMIPKPDLAYLDDIAEILLPALRSLGIEFSADPLVSIRLLVNGYLGAARQTLRNDPDLLTSGDHPQVEWFTVLVDKFLQPQSGENTSAAIAGSNPDLSQ